MSRPRIFGRSLLSSTMSPYFKGDKELFKGLKIETLEKEWKQNPVIHLDMSIAKGTRYKGWRAIQHRETHGGWVGDEVNYLI